MAVSGLMYYHDTDDEMVFAVTRALTSQSCNDTVLTRNIDPVLGVVSSQQEESVIKLESDLSGIDGWKNKMVEEWTPRDVLTWLSSEAQSIGVMIHELEAHNFAGFDGYRLKHMTEDDFSRLCSHYGHQLYHHFQSLRTDLHQHFNLDQLLPALPYCGNNEPDQFCRNFEDENSYADNCLKNLLIPDFDNSYDSGIESEMPTISPVIKRKPGRPKGSRKKKKTEKLGRLWEFIRDLLLNSKYCPSLICWHNYEEGMFKFVHSDQVAKLWGSKKDNPEMNYEKLSRAMRYYYKSKILQPVYGQRLVYKFGPTATGWKTPNPNFRKRG